MNYFSSMKMILCLWAWGVLKFEVEVRCCCGLVYNNKKSDDKFLSLIYCRQSLDTQSFSNWPITRAPFQAPGLYDSTPVLYNAEMLSFLPVRQHQLLAVTELSSPFHKAPLT